MDVFQEAFSGDHEYGSDEFDDFENFEDVKITE
mgnify:CR=1 FL=1